jgi:hypothetical protein
MTDDRKIQMPPDKVVTRLDGWVGRDVDPSIIPPAIAEHLVRQMPTCGDSIEAAFARMLRRHFDVLGHV